MGGMRFFAIDVAEGIVLPELCARMDSWFWGGDGGLDRLFMWAVDLEREWDGMGWDGGDGMGFCERCRGVVFSELCGADGADEQAELVTKRMNMEVWGRGGARHVCLRSMFAETVCLSFAGEVWRFECCLFLLYS